MGTRKPEHSGIPSGGVLQVFTLAGKGRDATEDIERLLNCCGEDL